MTGGREAPGVRLRAEEVAILGRLASRAGAPRGIVLGVALHLLAAMPVEELRERAADLKRRREQEVSCRS